MTSDVVTQIIVKSYPVDADANPITAAAVISSPTIDLSSKQQVRDAH